MELTSDYRIWISESRDAELDLAAERARVAVERAAEAGGGAGGTLLSRLRPHPLRNPRAVTR